MWKEFCLMTLLCISALSDLWRGKIYNAVIAAGLVSGLIFPIASNQQVSGYFYGMLIPLILFPFFCLKLIGAGDVKLLMVVGCYLGVEELYRESVWIVAGIAIWMVVYFVWEVCRFRSSLDVKSILRERFPMAPGVLIGMIIARAVCMGGG